VNPTTLLRDQSFCQSRNHEMISPRLGICTEHAVSTSRDCRRQAPLTHTQGTSPLPGTDPHYSNPGVQRRLDGTRCPRIPLDCRTGRVSHNVVQTPFHGSPQNECFSMTACTTNCQPGFWSKQEMPQCIKSSEITTDVGRESGGPG
jgi:hypothetical protein